jgi:hypothetical protein
LLVPVHWELEVQAPHPVAVHVSPALHSGTLLHMQMPATHALALLPQSASIQQSVAGIQLPLQSFSPATGHEVMGASWPESGTPECADVDPLVLEELLPPVSFFVVAPTSGVPVVASPASPASNPAVEEEAQPNAALNTRLQIHPRTSRMTPP